MQTRSLRRTPPTLTRTRSSLQDCNDKDSTSESSETLDGAQHTSTQAAALGETPQGLRNQRHPEEANRRMETDQQQGPHAMWLPASPEFTGSDADDLEQFIKTTRPLSRLLWMNAKRSGQHPVTCEATPPNGGPSIAVSP
jgi:hypothetical protein